MTKISTLALSGGRPLIEAPLPPYNTIGIEEERAVTRVMRSGVLSAFYGSIGDNFLGGPEVKRFEAAWAGYFGVRHAVSMNSATSGLIAAVQALGLGPGVPLPEAEVIAIAAGFQRVVVESLLDRLFETARWYGARSVGIAGGVSANRRLRADALARGAARGLPVFIPGLALSTDNAAMIAAAGLRRFRAGVVAGWDLNADSSLAINHQPRTTNP